MQNNYVFLPCTCQNCKKNGRQYINGFQLNCVPAYVSFRDTSGPYGPLFFVCLFLFLLSFIWFICVRKPSKRYYLCSACAWVLLWLNVAGLQIMDGTLLTLLSAAEASASGFTVDIGYIWCVLVHTVNTVNTPKCQAILQYPQVTVERKQNMTIHTHCAAYSAHSMFSFTHIQHSLKFIFATHIHISHIIVYHIRTTGLRLWIYNAEFTLKYSYVNQEDFRVY